MNNNIKDDDLTMSSGTIFDEIGYDEMQKAENHEIGFRLFRIMFFVVLIFAYVMIFVCEGAENTAGMVISLVLFGTVMIFYVMYAYMTAKRGIMNPKFAKGWSKTWVIVAYALIGSFWIYNLITDIASEGDLWDTADCVIWLIIISEAIMMSLCAKKNQRVLKKQLEENEGE